MIQILASDSALSHCLFAEKPRKCRRTARNKEVHECAAMGGEPGGAADLDINGECQFCFLKPCITERELYFVGSGQGPCEDNSNIRKEIYKRYWKVINNAGGWNDPRYLAIKVQRANGGEWAIQHRREVMPVCVLTQLRTLYPNSKEKPYMDHMWH